MKITDVEAIVLRQPVMDVAKADGSQDALLIRISTDEGITGIGEVDSLPPVIKAIVDAPPSHAIATGLKHLLVGENPLEIDRLWHKMYRGSIYYGRQGPAVHAISGIDIALWDIKGKTLGQPIHRLLGGPHRQEIRAYASTLMPDTPEETAAVVSGLVERGFTAIKLGWGPFGRDADLDVALVRAARLAAGDDIDLMFDIGLGWPNADHAIRQVRRFEEYRPYWVEEPLWPDETAAYRKLAATVETRIACGEEDVTRWGFTTLMDQTGVDVIQPDVTRAGGISECVRIAQLADLRGVTMVPHSWSTGIIKAASLHVIGAMPNATFLEYCVQETALNQLLTVERFPVVNGMVALPERPGLGIEIDEEVVEKYAVAG
ncbi:MAG: mandelate racemase/muconate lactonizing enzyme family protein [Thermomicrobiales bacterium]